MTIWKQRRMIAVAVSFGLVALAFLGVGLSPPLARAEGPASSAAKEDAARASKRGPIMIIGGAEERSGKARLLREFLKLAGGRRARIAVLTCASNTPESTGEKYRRIFEEIGVAEVRVLNTLCREDADSRDVVEPILRATGIFFSGGDQVTIGERLPGSRLADLLHRRHREGVVVGGTSAGAAAMADVMLLGGESHLSPRVGLVRTGPGLEFLPKITIDTHFAERGRLGRLLTALARHPDRLGIGLDNDTALVIRGDEAKVIGSGAVTIVVPGEAARDGRDTREAEEGEPLAVVGVGLHVLPEPCGFNLRTRLPLGSDHLARGDDDR